ncbi:MAG: GNAT family N-acetyltransferase [Ignavibacteria bacterium]|nr:GNAT family N-acetyltransferase [Ignavibacteria bacterium]
MRNIIVRCLKKKSGTRKIFYHIIFHNNQPAGYSKIVFNLPHSNIPFENVTKMERIYLLKEFYNLKLGFELFSINIELSKNNNQTGMWLYVWKENLRAVRFYKRAGFKIIGSYDFKITDTHSNPNHQMFLRY